MLKDIEKEYYLKELSNSTYKKEIYRKGFESFLGNLPKYMVQFKELKKYKIDDLLKKEGIEVKINTASKTFMRASLEIEDNKKLITIYLSSLEEVLEKSEKYSLDELIEICKVHEYFHVLEYKGKIDLEVLKTNKKFFFLERRVIDPVKIEVMCHEFVKYFLDLDISPITI